MTDLFNNLLTRRNLVRFACLSSLAMPFALADVAWAGSELPFTGWTVGEYLRAFNPDSYESMHSELKTLVDNSPMYSNPSSRADIGGSVSLNASGYGSTVSFNFLYTCSIPCDSLSAYVTVMRDAALVYDRTFYGAGNRLSGSDAAYGLQPGTYSVVVTAWSPKPPAGTTSSYVQDWQTVYL